MTVDLNTATASATSVTIASSGASATSHHGGGSRGMPLIVPASELYFWSAKWQEQEREFERARAAGDLVEADSMNEVIRDLMRVVDDE